VQVVSPTQLQGNLLFENNSKHVRYFFFFFFLSFSLSAQNECEDELKEWYIVYAWLES